MKVYGNAKKHRVEALRASQRHCGDCMVSADRPETVGGQAAGIPLSRGPSTGLFPPGV